MGTTTDDDSGDGDVTPGNGRDVERDGASPDEGPDAAADSTEAPSGAGTVESDEKRVPRRLRISLSVTGVVVGLIVLALVAVAGTTTWLYFGEKSELSSVLKQDSDNRRAEQVALDYAVAAAVMDYKDLAPWKEKLVSGTTPELSDKLTQAATAMEQILLPMQWSSTAKPLAAKVRSRENGVYTVDAFVSVMTKTVQAEDSLQSTATYSVTIDSTNGWKISDVGGIATMVGDK